MFTCVNWHMLGLNTKSYWMSVMVFRAVAEAILAAGLSLKVGGQGSNHLAHLRVFCVLQGANG